MTKINTITNKNLENNNSNINEYLKELDVDEIDLSFDSINSIVDETSINKNSSCFNALRNDVIFSKYIDYLNNTDYDQLQLSLQPIHYVYNKLVDNNYNFNNQLGERIEKLNDIFENSKYFEMGKDTSFLKENIGDFLNDRGSSIEKINDVIKNDVENAGPGTRQGVVAAAKALANELLKYDVRLPYISGIKNKNYGKYDGYGINPQWGDTGVWFSEYYNMNYYQNGLDCSGFIDWAIHNGGYKYNQYGSAYYRDNVGKSYNINEYVAKPGDLLWKNGHVGLVVDCFDDQYTVAEEHGGGYGLILSEYDIKSPGEFTNIIDMTSFYEDNNNKDPNY